jgi:AraC-like DNA-binding protein
MIGLEVIRSVFSTGRPLQQEIELAEYLPHDVETISAVVSERKNLQPKLFNFDVPPDQVLVGVRLRGNTLIHSHRWKSTQLLTAGSVYILTGGRYSALFAKQPSKTVFLIANRSAVSGLEYMFRETCGELPCAQIDLESDSKMRKVEAILGSTEKQSFFKYSALMADIFDQITEPHKDLLLEYGVSLTDPTFEGLCANVINRPDEAWTTALAAQQCAFSVYHFSRTFRAKTGHGFHEFVGMIRAKKAVNLICRDHVPMESAFQMVGVGCAVSANKTFQRELGFSVADVRRFSQSKEIHHVR